MQCDGVEFGRGAGVSALTLRVQRTTLFVINKPFSLTGGHVGAQHAAPLREKTIMFQKSVVP
jgi:hypothetical protein